MMVVQYVVCDAANVDPSTQQCSQVQYVQAPTMLPPMSAGSGAAIASAILAVWALAWVYKHC